MKPSGGLLGSFFRWLRRLNSSRSSQPANKIDDTTLEHLLLYHGLVGSSPENQPDFKDIRLDILAAIDSGSSQEMCIALKLPPLWWEDKLQVIITEAASGNRPAAITCLLPSESGQELPSEVDPLRHSDWHVRANAAHMLGALGELQAVPRLVQALDNSAQEMKAAFCHIALSLSHLQSTESRLALERYLTNEESWFRVDAANALSKWPLQEAAPAVMQAMLNHHELSDYMAVAVARNWPAAQLIASSDSLIQEGAVELIAGVLQAASQTFAADIVVDMQLFNCWTDLVKLCQDKPLPSRIHTAIRLATWLESNPSYYPGEFPAAAVASLLKQEINQMASAVQESTLAYIKAGTVPGAESINELRNAIALAGQLRLPSAVPGLVQFLQLDEPLLDDVIKSLGDIGDISVAPYLVQLANQLVDLNNRTKREPTTQPVTEADTSRARTYWEILRALGHLPCQDSVSFLMRASQDFAADKRQQAISSLLSICSLTPEPGRYQQKIHALVEEALHDPAAPVRLVAIEAVAGYQFLDLIPEVIKICHAKEPSLRRQVFRCLRKLYAGGHQGQVIQDLQSTASREFAPSRRQRLNDFLLSLSQPETPA